jgi:hypothetical protein
MDGKGLRVCWQTERNLQISTGDRFLNDLLYVEIIVVSVQIVWRSTE